MWRETMQASRPPDDRRYANSLIGFQVTGGSSSVPAMWEPLRRAGAVARVMLISAAAQGWNVDPTSCRAEKGEVIHGPTGRKLRYGALADTAAALPVPDSVALKDAKAFKLIGTPAKRVDTPDKVNGKALFGIDVKIPGMKIATVAALPGLGRQARPRRRQYGDRDGPAARASPGFSTTFWAMASVGDWRSILSPRRCGSPNRSMVR